MSFHLLPCHENVFYNHANVHIESVEVNGYPWGKIDIAMSQVLAFFELCAMYCQDGSKEIDWKNICAGP